MRRLPPDRRLFSTENSRNPPPAAVLVWGNLYKSEKKRGSIERWEMDYLRPFLIRSAFLKISWMPDGAWEERGNALIGAL
jgi:hypothetical protein